MARAGNRDHVSGPSICVPLAAAVAGVHRDCGGTLALGIGANLTMFSLMRAVLWRPLPYPEPNRIVMIQVDARNVPNTGATRAEVRGLKERSRSLQQVSMIRPGGRERGIRRRDGARGGGERFGRSSSASGRAHRAGTDARFAHRPGQGTGVGDFDQRRVVASPFCRRPRSDRESGAYQQSRHADRRRAGSRVSSVSAALPERFGSKSTYGSPTA